MCEKQEESMKKGIIIGGVIVLLLGAAGTCLALAKDARTAAIKAALENWSYMI